MRTFAVVPVDPIGVTVRASLQAGWTGAWDTTQRMSSIRRGIWGGYADVKMEASARNLFVSISLRLIVLCLLADNARHSKPSSLHQDSIYTSRHHNDEGNEV